MIDKSRFANTCGEYGISLTARQLDMFDKYREILVEYNEKVNLTAITDPVGIENKHFLDSLLFAKNPLVEGKVVDVGTGAEETVCGFLWCLLNAYKVKRKNME